MKAYKVVRKLASGKMVSSIMRDERYELEYKIGETTVPVVGKIFVFVKAESAKEWVGVHEVILIVEAIEVSSPPKYIIDIGVAQEVDIEEFWTHPPRVGRPRLLTAPFDTKLASEVKVIQEYGR